MQVLIVTGLSGAGKSNAMNNLEDMGYYCIDNMPPALVESFLNLEQQNRLDLSKAAFVMDTRSRGFFRDFERVLGEMREAGRDFKVLFLEATDETLLRRFKETRRVHPLSEDGTSLDAIVKERKMLSRIRKNADYIIDTTNLKTMDLQNKIREVLTPEKKDGMFSLTFQSFGYKHGMTADADIVFDVRFIKNPYYIKSLKDLTGNNKKVREYVMKFEETKEFVNRTSDLIEYLIPYYMKQGKQSLVVAFGCTGGQHRSVSMANELSDIFRAKGREIKTVHRDVVKR